MANEVRLTAIDASNIDVHVRLNLDDQCFFIYEYTSHKGFSFSVANNLISNLKKKPTTSGSAGYYYKGRAINECASLLRQSINPSWLQRATLVPAPPSKSVGDPDYDNRMEQVCKLISPNVDVRNLVRQTQSTVASHEVGAGQRATVQDLLSVYEIDEHVCLPAPTQIGIVDDVLTNGTHFRALQTILSARYPQASITGLFIARRVFPDDETDVFETV